MKDLKALLIIDMQIGSFISETPRYNSEKVIANYHLLGVEFRSERMPIVFIQHDGKGNAKFTKGSEAWDLLEDHIKVDEDFYLYKYANDAFYNTDLETKLKELEVNTLYIAGYATDFCDKSTIQSAIGRDFNVVVISDAHTTADRPLLKAEYIVSHYNWVLKNRIPTNGPISVISTHDLMQNSFLA